MVGSRKNGDCDGGVIGRPTGLVPDAVGPFVVVGGEVTDGSLVGNWVVIGTIVSVGAIVGPSNGVVDGVPVGRPVRLTVGDSVEVGRMILVVGSDVMVAGFVEEVGRTDCCDAGAIVSGIE